jgi:cytochrome c-type biogenesis protein CcmE
MSTAPDGVTRWWVRRRALVALIGVGVAALAVIVVSALNGALTYYKTPTEIEQDPGSAATVRVSGLVEVGSVHRHGQGVAFTLTDGVRSLHVVSYNAPASTFRSGQGAVVQGRIEPDGRFLAQQVIVRHSDQYEPASSASTSGTR